MDALYSWFFKSASLIFSSFVVIAVPFCYTMDLGTPSNIFDGSAASPQTPGASTVLPSVTNSASEIRATKPNLNTRHIFSDKQKSSKLFRINPSAPPVIACVKTVYQHSLLV